MGMWQKSRKRHWAETEFVVGRCVKDLPDMVLAGKNGINSYTFAL